MLKASMGMRDMPGSPEPFLDQAGRNGLRARGAGYALGVLWERLGRPEGEDSSSEGKRAGVGWGHSTVSDDRMWEVWEGRRRCQLLGTCSGMPTALPSIPR